MSGGAPEPHGSTPLLTGLLTGGDAMLALLFDDAPVAQAVLDRAGRLRRANPALRRLAGEGCADGTSHITALFLPTAHVELRAALQSALDGAGAADAVRGVPLAPAGTATVDILATAVREADGRVSGLLLHLCDAGERTSLAEQLAQASALGEIGQRAGGMVHDFNNLLMTITGTVAEALARAGLDGVTRAGFSEIGGAARRGAALARQLLDGGPQSGAVVLGIDAALRTMAVPLRRALGGLALTLVPEQPDAVVRIDPAHLDRVLMNLVLNARNAMPAGGMLSVRSGVRDVTEVMSQFGDAVTPGRYVTVAVRDTGTGIPAAIMPRLFEPFFTTRADTGGTGLGLASVRDLVRQAGGFLTVDSAPGRGTTVCVHLPRHATSSGEATKPADADDGSRAAFLRLRTVLLVDDEPVLLRLAERALSRAGWGVLAAASAAAALDAARQADPAPSLLVSDMTLPDRDGLLLVGEVRQLFPGLPAILTSGYASEALRDQAAATGVAFLSKPYGMAELLDTIGRVLQPHC